MDRIFRIASVAAIVSAGSLVFVVASTPALGQTSQSITCQPTTVSVAPSSGNLVVSCTTPGGGGTTPCSVSVSPTSLTSGGGRVTVTASNCGTITSWTGTYFSTSAAPPIATNPTSFTDMLPPNSGTTTVPYTYNVVGSTGSASTTVNVTPLSTGPGTGSCAGAVVLPWPTSQYITVGSVTGATPLVIQFQVPPGTAVGSTFSAVRLVQFASPDSNASFTSVLSSSCGSFASDPTIGSTFATARQNAAFGYVVGGPAPSPGYSVLQPGGTYYLNIKNTGGTGSHVINVSITGY